MDEAAAGERDEVLLLLAPARERDRPLLRAAQLVDLLAALDDGAVDEAGRDRRQLAGRHGDHRLVEQREAGLDVAAADAHDALLVHRDREQVGVSEALPGLRGRGELALVAALERCQQRQVAALDAVSVAQQPLRAGEPAARLGGVAAQRQEQPDPERAADGRLDRAGLHVRAVRPFQLDQVLGLVAEHVGGQGEQLEVLGAEISGRRQRGMGLLPRPSGARLPSPLKLVNHAQ